MRQTPVREVLGDGERPVGGLTYDSRAVKPGDCFFAVRGTQADGHADDSSIIVPYESLGSDNKGDYVYKFQNKRAEKQYVIIECELTDGAKIKSGLKDGDRIIKNISELSDSEAQAIHIEGE